jgi:UDP-N-acetylmuramoylalanine--D-glutamate ligase
MRVLVYGLGRSGVAVSQLARRQGHSVIGFDSQPKPEQVERLRAAGADITERPLTEQVDICIAAPGVPYDHPDLQALRERDIETIGEVEWVARTVQAPMVGITGTAGKGSVTRWLTDMLVGAGLRAVAGGNIDPALAEVARADTQLIVELSSFQLERCPTLKPKVAIVLNLGVDHLDRHGTIEQYHEAKRAIIRNQDSADTFIYNADDSKLREWASTHPGKTLGFSASRQADAYLQGDWLMLENRPLLRLDALQITGQHQYTNALAVALAARTLGLTDDAIRQGLRAFSGLPGRYAYAGQLGAIRFIEDSIATRTLAVKAALEATPYPVVWIAGGVDKGADFSALEPIVKERVVLFVGIGQAAEPFVRRLAHLTKTIIAPEPTGAAALERACTAAVSHLQQYHQGQGTVLLAPLAASFDQFADYKARAQTFYDIVASLERTWISC